MWKPDAPSSNSPPSKLESSPDLIELFLPGTNSAIDFSEAELTLQQAESILTCTLSDMIYGSCDHWHLNHLQSGVLHGDKNNLIRWPKDMRRDREFLENIVINHLCGCKFFMGNTHCSYKRFSAGLIPPRKFSPQLEIAVVGRTIKSESERGTFQCQCCERVHYDMLQSC